MPHRENDFLLTAIACIDAYDAATDLRLDTLRDAHGLRIVHTFACNAIAEAPLPVQHACLARLAAENRCRTLLIDPGLTLPLPLCLALKADGCCLVSGAVLEKLPDAPLELAPVLAYDACLTTRPAISRMLRRLGLTPLYQPIALDRRLSGPLRDPAAPRDIDILCLEPVWGTTNAPRRLAALARLAARGCDARAWGPGFAPWPEGPGGDRPPFPLDPVTGEPDNPVACLGQAKIGLAFGDSPPGRLARIALGGALLVGEPSDTLLEHFTPGSEVVTYADLDELVEKCLYYRDHEAARLAIARRGQEKARRRFLHDRLLARARRTLPPGLLPPTPDAAADRTLATGLRGLLLAHTLDDAAREALLASLVDQHGPEACRRRLQTLMDRLPPAFQVLAEAQAERLLLRAVTSGAREPAGLLLPLCLPATHGASRFLVLTCALHLARPESAAQEELARELAHLAEALCALHRITGATGDPFFDDARLKQQLVACRDANRRLALFGAGGNGRAWAAWIGQHLPGLPFVFADNDPAKQHTQLDGVAILAPHDLPRQGFDRILATSLYAEPLSLQLTSMQYVFNEQFFLTRGLEPYAYGLEFLARILADRPEAARP